MADPIKSDGNEVKKADNQKTMLIVALIIALLLLAGGCKMMMRFMAERDAENQLEDRTGVNMDRNGDTTTYTDQDGNQVTVNGNGNGGTVNYQGTDGSQGQMGSGSDARVPENFPSNFPVLLDGKLIASVSGSEGTEGDSGFHLEWEVDGSVADAVSYYQRELAAKGWTVTATSDVGGQTAISFERDASNGDKDGGVVLIGEVNGKTNVTVNLGVQ